MFRKYMNRLTNAMTVSVNIGPIFLIVHEWQVIVDDHVNLLDIDSTGNDVRCDENLKICR